ncbi:MAG: DUF308 domain-containing protein [Treponema sp.]|nr:DUF308 domain-containing protein [Treponema sp.]
MSSGLFFSALAVVLGIFCAVLTDFSIKIVVIGLGAIAIVKGVFDFIRLRPMVSKEDTVFHRTVLIRSLVSIVIGLVAVALPMVFFKTAETVVHVMLYVLGIYFLFCAIGGMVIVRRMKNAELQTKPYSSSIAVYLLISILLFLLATIGVKNILRGAGIIVAICGVFGCIYSWRNRPQSLTPDSIETEDAEVIEAVVKEETPVDEPDKADGNPENADE